MCMMLYLGTDNEMPLETEKYGKYLKIMTIDDDSKAVEKHFKLSNHYYIGSYQGCGCGFEFDFENEYVPELNADGKRSVEALFGFLKSNVKGSSCELVSCWSGDEDKDIEIYDEIYINNLDLTVRFRFREKQYIKLILQK